ncbi:GntR family transcriptional regulator [Comamonas nitrativorans]|uniref:GntR family transcriptional regulator n=1 Tax=Comamonas nitrativorans TaxID=108437 RepID=A0ABV9GUL9_9BURK|nr:GntR family transcriptional regulator [Comamonas sp.]
MPPNTALLTDPSPPLRSDSAVVQTPAFSPLYQQIKGLILQSLQAGEWKPGELIPSEMELAARFKVSQGTVRKAIDELAAENLVTRRQGKGTFVTTHNEEQVQYRFLQLHPDVGQQQDEGRAQRNIMECRRMRASADIARILGLRTGDSVIHVRRVLSFGGTPTILEDIWLPSQVFKGLTAQQMAHYPGPTYAMFEMEYGVRMVRAEEKIRAVLPDTQQAQWLKTTATTPLLSVERVTYTYNDKPMELRRGLYLTDSHHYRNALS